MAKFMLDGQEYCGGSTNYASSVTCTDAEGNESTVQAEIDKNRDDIDELNKNKQDIITNLVDVDPDTIKNTCVISTTRNTPSGHVMMIASIGDGIACVQIATEYQGFNTGATYARNNLNNTWSDWYQLK